MYCNAPHSNESNIRSMEDFYASLLLITVRTHQQAGADGQARGCLHPRPLHIHGSPGGHLGLRHLHDHRALEAVVQLSTHMPPRQMRKERQNKTFVPFINASYIFCECNQDSKQGKEVRYKHAHRHGASVSSAKQTRKIVGEG